MFSWRGRSHRWHSRLLRVGLLFDTRLRHPEVMMISQLDCFLLFIQRDEESKRSPPLKLLLTERETALEGLGWNEHT